MIDPMNYCDPLELNPLKEILKGLIAVVLLALGCLMGSRMVCASVYVSDGESVEVVSNLGPNNHIVQWLEAGTQLDVLRHLAKEGYTKVALREGVTGWIQSSRLSFNPPGKGTAQMLDPDLKGLTAEQLEAKIAVTQTELNMVRQALLSAQRMDEEREHLLESLASLEAERAMTQKRKYEASGDQKQKWFAAGTLTGLLGVVFGFLAHGLGFFSRYGSLR